MGYWNTRGLRGSAFEDLINHTNETYKDKGLGLIQKIPTSVTVTKIDKEKRTITEGYFEKKSTVDYIGVVQGLPICFEAKETTKKSLPLQNIHAHQIDFMEQFERQKGLAFLLVSFTAYNEVFYMPYCELLVHWKQSQETGGRKSIPYANFDHELLVPNKSGCTIHYLEAISIILKRKN